MRVSRKEIKALKAPDEFVTLTGRVVEWFQQNRTMASWMAGGAVILAVILAVNSSFRAARAREANADLGRALLAMRNGEMAQATNGLTQVADRWRASLPGQIAVALKPSAQLRSGASETVVSDAPGALQSTPDLPPYLHQQVRFVWAVALEDKSQWKEAAEKYAETASGSGPYRGLAVLGEARVREQLGEKDRARELYQKYIEEFPDDPGRELAEAKLRKN